MDWLQEEGDAQLEAVKLPAWKIAIVDDDQQVHQMTELALSGFRFEGRPLKFYKAYDGAQAMALFQHHPDIALVLLDVVMEKPDAGLRVVEFVRDDLKNSDTRIILRTGQCGVAPEDQIVRHYDIDGYRSKTEMTHQILTHIFYNALASYRNLMRLKRFKQGMSSVMNALCFFDRDSKLADFAECLLEQISSVLGANHVEFWYRSTRESASDWHILQADQNSQGSIEPYQAIARAAAKQQSSISRPPLYAYYHRASVSSESVFVVHLASIMDGQSEQLLALYSHKILHMLEQLTPAQKPGR